VLAFVNGLQVLKDHGFTRIEIKFASMAASSHFWHGAPQIQETCPDTKY